MAVRVMLFSLLTGIVFGFIFGATLVYKYIDRLVEKRRHILHNKIE